MRWRHASVAGHRPIAFLLALCFFAGPAAAQKSDLAACDTGSGKSAVVACTRLIASGRYKAPILYLLYNKRGGAHQSLADHDKAIADFTEAVRIDRRSPHAYINRGVTWAALTEYDKAISDFDNAILADPKNASAYSNRGGVHRDRGRYELAMADFERAIALDPKNAAAYYNRGAVYQDRNAFDLAISDYNRALQYQPKDPNILRARGRAWSNKGDVERARADYRAALASPAKSPLDREVKDAVRILLAAIAEAAPEKKAAKPSSPELKSDIDSRPPAVGEKKAAEPIRPKAPSNRVALVVGNSSYERLRGLTNPRHDAEDLAKVLKALDFEVHLSFDAKHDAMNEALTQFAGQAQAADIALIFYAGHGLQRDGINYLAPMDAFVDEASTLINFIGLQTMIAHLQAARLVRILIVDACRDNGIEPRLAGRQIPAGRLGSTPRGLAAVNLEDGKGTLVAFATQPNNTAVDGVGRNSPFTEALLRHLVTPGLELRTLLTRVRAEVVNATDGRQRPEVVDSLIGEVVLKPAPVARR